MVIFDLIEYERNQERIRRLREKRREIVPYLERTYRLIALPLVLEHLPFNTDTDGKSAEPSPNEVLKAVLRYYGIFKYLRVKVGSEFFERRVDKWKSVVLGKKKMWLEELPIDIGKMEAEEREELEHMVVLYSIMEKSCIRSEEINYYF